MRCDRCGRTRPHGALPFPTPFAIGAALLLAACGGDAGPAGPDPEPEPSVATVEVTPGADTLTALGDTRSFTAVARDADGDEVTGVSFTWSTSDAAVATVDDQGVVTAEASGAADITALADGVAGSAALAVIQQAETVTVTPSSATLTTVGVTRAFTAAATDANGNPVEGAAFLWSSEDPSVATVDSAGVATSKGAGVSTITASVQGVPGHAALTVSQAIDRLAFRTQPTSATAGAAIDPAVQVEVLDAAGNVVTDAEIAITLSLGTNPGAGALGGTKTVNATAGVATFSGLWVDAAAAGYALAASSTGVTGATSAAFDIAAGPAARLAFASQPADATAGKAIDPLQAEVQDAYGNLVTGSTAEVSVALAANPAGGTLAGTVTVAASGGAATFSGLWLDRAATGYKLAVAASGLAGDVSTAFTVWPGEPAQLGFVTQPSAAEGQEPISPAVRVAVQDAYGNTVSTASPEVTVALHSNATGDTLAGTTIASPVDGVAAFPDLSLGLPATGYSVLASAAGLDPVESEPFTVALTFAQVSAGEDHSCGVTAAGHTYCWGANASGQLGDGTTTGSPTPVPVATTESFAEVGAGGSHSCAVTTAGEPFCWGDDTYGQLGAGSIFGGQSSSPVAVNTADSFAHVAPGSAHTCGVTTTGAAFCWGLNNYGQLGNGTTTDGSVPIPVDVSALTTQTFAQVSTHQLHTCGVTTADEPYCWGRNAFGQLGNGTTTDRTTPVAVDVSALTTQTFARVSAGGDHTCGLTTADEPFCWGYNSFGQLGDGTTTQRITPVAVDVSALGTPIFARLRTGGGHTCGVTTAGEAYCWGYNVVGQLGDGTTNNVRSTPVAVDASGLPTQAFGWIATGAQHSCAVTTADEAYCWGANDSGQLGDGTTTSRSSPVRVVQ